MNKKKNLLEKAEKYIFSTGLNDASSHLSKVNMKYGLAKMHFVQAKLGLEANATFISSPDESITRNVTRWEQGISYGGKISWGNGKEKLVMLDTKPNCCGMLVGALDKIPKPEDIIRRLYSLEQDETYIDDVKIEWDFWKGNHFIDVFTVHSEAKKMPKYALILHAGCPEFKGDNIKGFGLYWNESDTLYKICEKIETPFGKAHILQGSHAKDYMKLHQIAERFSLRRRAIAFKKIFDCSEKNIITNETHQGLLNMNEVILGCHNVDNEHKLFPISIRADLPSYLMHGRFNFTKETIEDLGFKERAEQLGVYNKLRKANILPHGGGYMLNDSLQVNRVIEFKDKRFFELDMIDGVGKKIILNATELEFSYRSTEVVKKTIELGLGKPVARLDPVYTLKI